MIRTSSKIDEEHIRVPLEYTRAKNGAAKWLVFCIIAVFFVIKGMIKFFRPEGGMIQLTVLMELTLAFFMFIILRFMVALLSRRVKAPKCEMRSETAFEDDFYSMTTYCENGEFKRRRRYESIAQAVEYKDWFLIYLTNNEVRVIKNTELTEGTPDELREFLKDKLGTRFSLVRS